MTAAVRVWPPAWWCRAINSAYTHICDQPHGHDGDHSGPALPTIQIDEPGTPPAPPKPPEPLGLGAVVENAQGDCWVRTGATKTAWRCAHLGEWRRWSDIDAVRVLSEGVTP